MSIVRFREFSESSVVEKATSKSQQRLMGMALAYKRGELDDASPEVKKVADSMSIKDLEDFAKTKHDNLPEAKNNARTISISQRQKAKRLLKRIKTRIKVARKRALKKTANTETLKKRAKRSVRNSLFKKFSQGQGRGDVSISRRGSIERRINRLSPQRIKAMSVRQIRKSRKTDRSRRMNRNA